MRQNTHEHTQVHTNLSPTRTYTHAIHNLGETFYLLLVASYFFLVARYFLLVARYFSFVVHFFLLVTCFSFCYISLLFVYVLYEYLRY